ncbi:MAG: hypothetical protein JNM56_25445 [Planctomycetia bacterium]|nr:hypothetical protein [Planctomycetia bacterium]
MFCRNAWLGLALAVAVLTSAGCSCRRNQCTTASAPPCCPPPPCCNGASPGGIGAPVGVAPTQAYSIPVAPGAPGCCGR